MFIVHRSYQYWRSLPRLLAQVHGFVLLLGDPAAGKSAIATMLALAAAGNGDCLTVKPQTASELVTHWSLPRGHGKARQPGRHPHPTLLRLAIQPPQDGRHRRAEQGHRRPCP
jgi:Mrp family chromosome partitioning ATPase